MAGITSITTAPVGVPQSHAQLQALAAPQATVAQPIDAAAVQRAQTIVNELANAMREVELNVRMSLVSGFDAKNAVFHQYFDTIPAADESARKGAFFTFMAGIEKADQDRVMKFLEAQPK
jgi:hypothetical protein